MAGSGLNGRVEGLLWRPLNPKDIKLAKNQPSADEGARRWKELPDGLKVGLVGLVGVATHSRPTEDPKDKKRGSHADRWNQA